MRFKRFILPALLLLIAICIPLTSVFALSEEELNDKKKVIEELQKKLIEVDGQKQTLSKTINYLSTRITLTEKQVEQTEDEIETLETEIGVLSGKIDKLNVSLDSLTEILLNRINASYKSSFQDPIYLLLATDGFSNFFRRYKYLKVSQAHDREVMFALENARTTFDTQRQVKQEKQDQVIELQQKLESQQVALQRQQAEKTKALEVTKNDEKNYQSQLQKALSELEAIQSIIAGRGKETEAGNVEEGATIASVIPSSSACSNGAHLHFEVAQKGVHLNPASYLSGKSVTWDNSPDGTFGFGGSWRWPLEGGVRITQGYGMTFYAATLRYYGGAPHTGIDMMSTEGSLGVKAVRKGKLYRGAIACGGGSLRYVKVDHADDDYDTYYLHVNY